MSESFSLDELGLLHTMIGMSLENVDQAPAKIANLLYSIESKLETRIEIECNIFNEFQQLTTQLEDVYLASKILVKNPDAITTEYNN